MESAQQFHLKWNNHSLNTLSSFQNLLDTHTLVDVTLTCSNGKTMEAHRMVLAACSEYFYRLFKDLPERHPVIVFKDAGEEIVRDMLLFMYKGEVEVQESYLNDFLKFADTLQVKGLSHSEQRAQEEGGGHARTAGAVQIKPESPIKSGGLPLTTASASPSPGLAGIPPPQPPSAAAMPDLSKSFLAAAASGLKFPPLFLPTEPASAAELLSHLSSPNLYRALHRKYQSVHGAKFPDPDSPVFKNMPFLKHMFGNAAEGKGPLSAADLSMLYPPLSMAGLQRDDTDSESISERSPPPPSVPMPLSLSMHAPRGGEREEDNGAGADNNSPMALEAGYSSGPENSNPGSTASNAADREGGGDGRQRGGGKVAGRGSRLERMIAAEYKVMSEYVSHDQPPDANLPVVTPELMKSRRTHSLQLAIGEILHNRASVQSAATKYQIPRETLRRHYQRYLKAMGLNKLQAAASAATGGSAPSAAAIRSSVPTNNNAKVSLDAGADESSNGFSSLMDIGQAYGIWNPDTDGSDFRARMKDGASGSRSGAGQRPDKDDKELVIDEETNASDSEEEEEEEDELNEEEEEEAEEEPQRTDSSKEDAKKRETEKKVEMLV
jgi:hypothetical protein